MNSRQKFYVGTVLAAWVLLLCVAAGVSLAQRIGEVASAVMADPEPAGQAQTARVSAIGLVNHVDIGQTQTTQPEPEPDDDGGRWSLQNVILLAALIACVDGAILIFSRPRREMG